MKYYFTLFLIIFLIDFSNPQLPTKPNAYDADSLKTGEWITYLDSTRKAIKQDDPNLKYYRISKFEKGLHIATTKEYFANGELFLSYTIKHNPFRNVGPFKALSEEGRIIFYVYFDENGVRNLDKTITKLQELTDQYAKEIPEHIDYYKILNRLGYNYQLKGMYSNAEFYLSKNLKLGLKILGANHREMIEINNELALLYRDMGRYEEGVKSIKKAIDISEKEIKTHKKDISLRINLGTLKYNAGLIYSAMNEYKKAIPYYKESLEIAKKETPTQYDYISNRIGQVSKSYLQLNMLDEAKLIAQENIAICNNNIDFRRKKLTCAEVDRLMAQINMAVNENIEESETFLLDGLSLFNEHFGENGLRTIKLKSILLNFYYFIGKKKEA